MRYEVAHINKLAATLPLGSFSIIYYIRLMKKATIILFVFLNATFLHSQIKDTAITFSKVMTVDSSLKSAELYARARAWFAVTYRSGKDVIQLEDKENGKLIGKGAIKYTSRVFVGSEGTKGWIYYTITIQIKDGRYKYELTDFIHEGNPYNSGGQFSFDLITSSEECPREFRMTNKSWRNKV
jgi:hypothetical protein